MFDAAKFILLIPFQIRLCCIYSIMNVSDKWSRGTKNFSGYCCWSTT